MLVGDTGGRAGGDDDRVLYFYQRAFLDNQYGYGAAIGWALFILIVLFTIINWRLIGADERIARRAPPARWKEQADAR